MGFWGLWFRFLGALAVAVLPVSLHLSHPSSDGSLGRGGNTAPPPSRVASVAPKYGTLLAFRTPLALHWEKETRWRSSSERKGNRSNRFKDFCLKAKATTWP